MLETICLAVKPHQRGDIFPPVCSRPLHHDGKHKSIQRVFIMSGLSEPYEW